MKKGTTMGTFLNPKTYQSRRQWAEQVRDAACEELEIRNDHWIAEEIHDEILGSNLSGAALWVSILVTGRALMALEDEAAEAGAAREEAQR